MDNTIFITVQAALSAICWLIVAGGAALAMFAKCIHDTLLERIGLAAVSITATGAAFRIASSGWVNDGNAVLSMAMAFYAASVAYKHVRGSNA